MQLQTASQSIIRPKSSVMTSIHPASTTDDILLLRGCPSKVISYVQDNLNKIKSKDVALTKLILDDFRFPPHVVVDSNDWSYDGDSTLDEITLIRLMETATASILSQATDCIPSPLQQLEFRFVTLSSSPELLSAVQDLVQAKQKMGSCWKSISLVGCCATPQAWSKILLYDHGCCSIVQACEELVLNHNSLPLEAYQSLGDAMRSASTTIATAANMTCLHIQRETITDDNAKALFGRRTTSTCVVSSPHLKVPELILNFCRLDDGAVHTLSRQYLRYNDQLQILNLGACYLSDRQLFSIFNALCNHKPALHTLILTLNHCHTQGCLALQELLSSSHCQLRHLNISHQKLHGCKLLHMAALAEGVSSCPTLQELNLSRNQLTAHDIDTLMNCLENDSSSSTLQSLDVSSNPLGRPGLACIATCLPSLRTLKRVYMTNTVPQQHKTLEDDDDINDDNQASSAMLWSRKVKMAMENLPLALVQGLQRNTSLEYVDICRMEWLSPVTKISSTSAVESPGLSKRSYGNLDDSRWIPDGIIQQRSEEQLLDLIRYYNTLNIGGRKLLSSTTMPPTECTTLVPLGLWPLVLERAQTSCRSSNIHTATAEISLVPDVLFHFLRQCPSLASPRKNEVVVKEFDYDECVMTWDGPCMYVG
jgi:hypothetical protein